MRGFVYFVGSFVIFLFIIAVIVENKWEQQGGLLAYLVESGMINNETSQVLRRILHMKKTKQYQEIDLMGQRSTNIGELTRFPGTEVGENHVLQATRDGDDLYSSFTRFWGHSFNHHWFSTRRLLAQISGEAPAPSPTLVSAQKTPLLSPNFPPHCHAHRQAPAASQGVSSHHQPYTRCRKVSSHHQPYTRCRKVSSHPHHQAPAPPPRVPPHHRAHAPLPTVSSCRPWLSGKAPSPFPRVPSHHRAHAPSPTVSSCRPWLSGKAPAPSPRVPSHHQAHAPSPLSGKTLAPSSTVSSPNQSFSVIVNGTAPAPSPTSPLPSSTSSFSPLRTNSAKSPLYHISFPNFHNQSLLPMGVNNGSGVPSSNQNISKGAVVIAVAATASVTFSISVLLFLFWLCCCRPNSSRHKAKDKPHILLSSNRYSTATPHKPFCFVTVANEQILRNRSFYDNLNHKVSGNIFTESHSLGNSIPVVIVSGNAANSVENSLQMPPGMSTAPKSPPGEPPPERIYPPTPPPGNATSPTSIPVLPTPTTPSTEPSSSAPCPPSPLPPPAKPSPGVSCPPSPPHPPPRPSSGVSCPPSPPPPPPRPSSGVSCSSSTPPPPSRPSSGTPCPPPPGPPPLFKAKNGLHPPPPPSACVPPPIGLKPSQRVPSALHHSLASTSVGESEAGAAKAKLKPLFWDKVMANPDHSMVWDHIRSGSFHFNEEMIENLFVYEPAGKNKNDRRKESSSQDAALQHIQLIDPKKSQILSIMLKASNVATHDVCAAIKKGNQLLPPELIQALLKMTPTTGEQIKLQEYTGELSQLSLAEQLLKVLVDIPFVFKRLESMLFLCTLPEDISMLRESFAVLEAGCTELRESRLFLRLLEAVLQTGNRMNDGTFRGGAQAFKLDTLLKLSDVKGTDGKTTLLHFVVQEIILSEGRRAARLTQGSGSISNFKSDDLSEDSNEDSEEYLRSTGLQVISGLGNELNNVKKAATLDIDALTATVSKLRNEVNESRALLNSMKNVAEENSFCQALMSNLQNAENDVSWSVEVEKRIESLVKSMGDYFHGNAGKHEGASLFMIVREFLPELDKVCEEVKKSLAKGKQNIPKRRKDTTATSLAHGSLTSVIPC